MSMLKRWAETGRHKAQIVGVMVSESPEQDDPGAQMRPYRKRDERWLATRGLLQPDPSTGLGRLRLRLRVDRQTGIQLPTPRLGSNSAGYSVVQSKKAMKQRGMKSPDRADAALLTVYEPADQPAAPPRTAQLTSRQVMKGGPLDSGTTGSIRIFLGEWGGKWIKIWCLPMTARPSPAPASVLALRRERPRQCPGALPWASSTALALPPAASRLPPSSGG
ncbi:hypothetical protein [Streptomyces bobili]